MGDITIDTSSPTVMPELYDPLFHTPQDDVYEVYAALRRDHPVYYNRQRVVWCLTRHADVQAAARDWKTFSQLPGSDLDAENLFGPGSFLDLDPPRHDVLRNVARPFFVPKAIAELTSDVTRRVDAIMAELRDKDSADLAEALAWQLPIWVISRLLGTPEEDDELIQRLLVEAETRQPGDEAIPERSLLALAQLQDYLSDLAEHKRRHPDERLLSRMVAGEAEGAPTAEEVVGMATILFTAGTETTVSLLGNLLNVLFETPDAVQALRRDETSSLIDAAIEEAIRFEAPVQYLPRTLTTSVTLHGVEIPKGERVVLLWAAANRDAERWERPDAFDIERPQHRHLGFGEGIHHCIGAPLARLEARIALPAFLRTFSEYEIGEKRRMHSHVVRGWQRLDATLTADPAATRRG